MDVQNIWKYSLTSAAFLILTIGLLSASADAPAPQVTLPCRVVSIHDGDTLTVDVTLRMNVRLLDCWAPEVNKPVEKVEGLKSKAKLESMAGGKSGLLTVPLGEKLGDSITLGRVLGRVIIDGKDVSVEMVRSGAATKAKRL